MQNIEKLKQQTPDFLLQAKKRGYICPVCGNGSGSDGDGITLNPNDPGRHYKCFKCGFSGDIIDLYGVYAGIDDPKEKIKATAEYYGQTDINERNQTKCTPADLMDDDPEEDYTDFLLQAEENNNYEYLESRGISENTQRFFHIGYCESWKNPKALHAPASPRCIIPRGKTSYLARDTREELTDEQDRYKKLNAGKTLLFNPEALTSSVVFVTEGEIDAMSIYEAGAEALALCSTANKKKLLDWIQKNGRARQGFVLMLDSDEAGERTQKELSKGLERLGYPYVVATLPEGIKDPNEYLIKDPEDFRAWISSLQAEVLEKVASNYENEYKAVDLLDYFRKAEERQDTFEASTGFYGLDLNLSGGLHEGLYIIGAISALGKTTFTLQLADQIARGGVNVLFFSLEMSKFELIAKSLSRHTFELKRLARTKDKKRFIARETHEILNNRRYREFDTEEKQVIADALERYEKYEAKNMFIYEGRYRGERLTVNHIRNIVKNHIEDTGAPCVVFVDYLQILAPMNPHATDKQNIDTSVFELKEISRDFSIPVVAISSFNRENYLEPVSMSSFKESGAVEYSSDVLLGLQYEGMEYKGEEDTKKRKTRIRELVAENERKKARRDPVTIDLKCLKNRNGRTFTLEYYMTAACNHFDELLTQAGYKEFSEKLESGDGETWDKVNK